jgi:2-oxoisovalerate dehydrogenase E1 component alpha subunit
MSYTDATIQLLSPDGKLVESDKNAEYIPQLANLSDDDLLEMHRQMVVIRRFDIESGNLQRQGHLGIWIPSLGQEAAQVGSATASRPQDHIFPAYREHVVARMRGVDLVDTLRIWRGLTHGAWNPAEVNNFHLYAVVLGTQTLHATGYAMGLTFDGATGTGNPEKDAAVITYFGDGASSQGDVNEALVFAASYQAPVLFFLQNNHWAISVPVSRQSRSPLYQRAGGFGIPGVQIDGNDVLASYAVTRTSLEATRAGKGPHFIEALTYRMGAHTTSDDPTKYRDEQELEFWLKHDPIARFEAHLRSKGVGDDFFESVKQEGEDVAADVRKRTIALGKPETSEMFAHVYTEAHALMQEQAAWLAAYEASFEGGAA